MAWALAALAVAGGVVWRRTRSLRRGGPVPRSAAPDAWAVRTSWTTHLAWMGGAGAVALGTGWVLAGRVAGAPVALAGCFVFCSGLLARVTGVQIDRNGMTVRYAARRPRRVEWSNVRRMSPPPFPLAGWRILDDAGWLGLMPSDLLGHEGDLDAVVSRAGLRFDGAAWSGDPEVVSRRR